MQTKEKQLLLIDGKWVDGGLLLEVRNKYNFEVVSTLPTIRRDNVDRYGYVLRCRSDIV